MSPFAVAQNRRVHVPAEFNVTHRPRNAASIVLRLMMIAASRGPHDTQ
jgi:hypothetical protein